MFNERSINDSYNCYDYDSQCLLFFVEIIQAGMESICWKCLFPIIIITITGE